MAQAEEIRTETGPLDYDYTEKEVELCQENLQNHKACSPDKIKNEMLKSPLVASCNPPTSRDPPTLRDYSISFPTSERLFHSDNVSLPALPNPPAEGRAKNFSVSEQKLFELTTEHYKKKYTSNKNVNCNMFTHFYSMASRYCYHKAGYKDIYKREQESLRQRSKNSSQHSKKRKRT
eukprot:g18292.t1